MCMRVNQCDYDNKSELFNSPNGHISQNQVEMPINLYFFKTNELMTNVDGIFLEKILRCVPS